MLFYLFFLKILTHGILSLYSLGTREWIRNDSWDILYKYFSGKFNITCNKDID